MSENAKLLQSNRTTIPGLTIWELPVYGDNRGWFKENWQREKMLALGLPDFRPVQNNISFNEEVGTTRGIHAEPWDKYISVATGRIFGAWVDLRRGPNFGVTFTAEIDPRRAVFVPRGVGNAFQTLAPNTAYSYLVNDYYCPDAVYQSVNLADESLGIPWPIPLSDSELSQKDRRHPRLAEISPVDPPKLLVLGADGQLGRALRRIYSESTDVEFVSRSELDLTSTFLSSARRWQDYSAIVNAAAYTAVDTAETREGRMSAWATNVSGVATLARIATDHGITLVHISSDYVFDGTATAPYDEAAPPCPLGVYGQTKAAGDLVVSAVPRHYIVRTSWVVGEGHNFVRTMLSLAERGVDPMVVRDQHGRLTFALDLARGIKHLIEHEVAYGTYNLTSLGPATSWADIAKQVFSAAGYEPERITAVSTDEYQGSALGAKAPRPRNSLLDLAKITRTGFTPADANESLVALVRSLQGAGG